MSDYVKWMSEDCVLNLGKLDPRLDNILLIFGWNNWMARVRIGERIFESRGEVRLDALGNLLNSELLLEELRK